MKNDVSYDQQTIQTPNPIARFAHRRRYAATLALVTKYILPNGSLLDFGCGNGRFLQLLADKQPDLSLFGFDPESGHIAKQYVGVSRMNEISDASMDVVCCFETLEHLHPEEYTDFIIHSKRVLRDHGVLIVSVPVIGGPPLLLKELNRRLLFQRPSDYKAGELLKAAFFGIAAPRTNNIRGSHKGFDFRSLRMSLNIEFRIVETWYSPLPWFPWFLNSQVFWVFKRIDI